LADLVRLPQTTLRTDIHCVTRWSKLDVSFHGVLLRELVDRARVQPAARFASFVARSARNHSSSLLLEDALRLGSLVAWQVDGQPLPDEHGGPIRLVVPGRYFYKSVKWLERIEMLAENRLGFWEGSAGYHDGADPWREERYMAPNLDRRRARQLIESRDFLGQDLRSIDCRGRDLSGLNAAGALLRDADFSDALLAGADFSRANLSNAKFARADLRKAKFVQADVEGAEFSGASLAGADFSGGSWFGTTFCQIGASGEFEQGATFDRATRFDAAALDQLTEPQRAYVERARR
jgi:hypothetical protein